MSLRFWIVAWVLSLSVGAPAFALSDADESTEEARRHVNDAKVAYTLGEFDKAIAAWKEAYRLKPLPAILFNLAQAYRLAGDYRESRFQYENYLRGLPNAPNRLEVERRIEQLSPLIAAERETKQAPEHVATEAHAPVAPPDERLPPDPDVEAAENKTVELPEDVFTDPSDGYQSSPRLAPWVVAAVAAACAVGSVVTYTVARSDWSNATSMERSRAQVDGYIQAGDTKRGVALGLGGVAAAAGIGSAVLFVF